MWSPYRLRRKWSRPRVFSTLHAALISKEITFPAASLLLLHTGSSGGVIPPHPPPPDSGCSQPSTTMNDAKSQSDPHAHTSSCTNVRPIKQMHKAAWKMEGAFHFVSFSCSSWGVEYEGAKKSRFLIKAVAPFGSLITGWSDCTWWIWPEAQTCNSWAAALLQRGSAQRHAAD